jgi:CBS domain-containing protein
MRNDDIGSIPVGENDRLIGMVTDRDIICRGIADGADIDGLTARDVMSKPIVYCRADDELEHAIRIMEKNKIRRLPVIDKDKRLTGMLALGDISAIGGEEMAGEVMRSVSAHHA